MADSEFLQLLASIREFGWDPKKRLSNLRDHKIDFEDAKGAFGGYMNIRRSDRHGETRYQVFGYLQGRPVAVICTVHGSLCWLISARRARRDERRKYYDYLPRRSAPSKGKTDWAALDALTDEEIEASIANDPDWQEFKDMDWSKAALVIPPKKKAISIRVDEDVLDYFRKEGAGYQRRMNAVLRSYMQQKHKKRA